MLVETLIEVARTRSRKSYKEMAAELEIDQSRISQWKKGQYWPGATEIAYFAIEAGLDVVDTIAQIESEKKPALSRVWERAGFRLGGNGGIRTLDEALHPILP